MKKMVAPWKKDEVKNLSKKLKESKVVGLVNIEGIPSKQFQEIRKKLRDKIDLMITRNRLINMSLEKAELIQLGSHMQGPTGVILTDLNPFQLQKTLRDCMIDAPAKGGSTSPRDIMVPAGDTSFPPGPILGELQAVGIKAKIEGGKIVIKEDSLVVKEGKEISPALAAMLTRMDIKPMRIGLGLQAMIEDGTVYAGDVLQITTEYMLQQMTSAHQQAFNLAFNSRIYTSDTVKYFIQKAYINSRNLALNAEIVNKETIKDLIAKAHNQGMALSTRMPELPVGEAKEEPSEGQKPEEKPEEAEKKEEDTPAKEPKEDTKEEGAAVEEEVSEEPPAEEKKDDQSPPGEPVKEEAAPEEAVKEEAVGEESKEEAPIEEPPPDKEEAGEEKQPQEGDKKEEVPAEEEKTQ